LSCHSQRRLDITPACRNDIDQVEALWAQCLAAAYQAGQTQGYLLGGFSIADAFFAPVVVRLRGYKVTVNPTTQTYMDTVLSTPAVMAWMAAGVKEASVLHQDEAGFD
jgi:glutathione S-transferase